MSVASRSPRVTPEPSAAATQLADASLVRIFTRQDGDALAAGGVLAHVLSDHGTAFHLAPTQSRAQRARRIETGGDETVTVAVGDAEQADITLSGANTTGAAIAIVEALNGSPPRTLALAGLLIGTGSFTESPVSLPERRHDTLGIPTQDPVVGIAHSLWVHAPFSGRPADVEALFTEVGLSPQTLAAEGDAMTRFRSQVAVAATQPNGPDRVDALRRLLAPHASTTAFPTVEGFADVLAVLAAEAPGIATSLVVGGDVHSTAVTAWKQAAAATHECLRTADTERYGGLFVVPVADGPVRTIATAAARLLSPEPVTLALGPEQTAVVARDTQSVRAVTAALTEATDGTSDGTKHRGVVTHNDTVSHDQRTSIARDVL